MKYYQKAMSAIHGILLALVSTGLAVMICVTSLEVVRRYIFGLSFPWSDELVKYLMIMVTFFGGAVAYQKKELVALDLLTGKLPKKLRLPIELLGEIVSVVLIAILFWFSLQAVLKPAVYKQVSVGLKISMAYPWASLPIGFGTMLLFSVEHFYTLISTMREREEN